LVYITLATLVAMRDLRDAALIFVIGLRAETPEGNGGDGGDGDFRNSRSR
jgi:hypothetical protein